jgi:5,10-methenyltetrahydromethanopterin hydrogenase
MRIIILIAILVILAGCVTEPETIEPPIDKTPEPMDEIPEPVPEPPKTTVDLVEPEEAELPEETIEERTSEEIFKTLQEQVELLP